VIHDRSFAELGAPELLGLLRLRVDVFVVEQRCAYAEIDGRDDEPATRHVWWAEPDGPPVSYVRLLDDGAQRRIGRVVTAPHRRGEGLAAALVRHLLATSDGPWVLHAQSHLAAWYGDLGFGVTGPEFVEDGIPHVPMRRDEDSAVRGTALRRH
jgi:ElaA protein